MLKIFDVPESERVREERNKDYRVKIDGTDCPVYNVRVSAVPFNGAGGLERPISQTEIAAFISFSSDRPVTLEIEFAKQPSEYPASVLTGAVKSFSECKPLVRPLSENVAIKLEKNKAVVRLDKCGQYVFEPYGSHCVLHIFFDEEKEYDKAEATMYFGPGHHFPGKVQLKSGDRIFIDRGAVVHGWFLGKGVSDVKIYGEGLVDGGDEKRTDPDCYSDKTVGNIRFYESENIGVEGIILCDSANWCCSFFNSEKIRMENIKIVGQWRYNTDGIDLINTSDVRIRKCFIRSFDDAIVLKAIERYSKNVTDITAEECICWCNWGRTLEIGLETACEKYTGICFRDCDLIHNSAVALDIQGGDYAKINDVLFENIRVEYSADQLPEVLQVSPDQKYDAQGKRGNPMLIAVTNPSIRESEMYRDMFTEEQRKDKRRSVAKNVCFKDIRVFDPEKFGRIEVEICSLYDGYWMEDIKIAGVTMNGEKVIGTDKIDLKLQRVRNFSWE